MGDKALTLLPFEFEAPGLSPARATFMGECAAVCLEVSNHLSGVELQVDADQRGGFEINWHQISLQHFRSYGDLQEATEHGACGLAILLVTDMTGNRVIERAAKGLGFDFWLGSARQDLPFQG